MVITQIEWLKNWTVLLIIHMEIPYFYYVGPSQTLCSKTFTIKKLRSHVSISYLLFVNLQCLNLIIYGYGKLYMNNQGYTSDTTQKQDDIILRYFAHCWAFSCFMLFVNLSNVWFYSSLIMKGQDSFNYRLYVYN